MSRVNNFISSISSMMDTLDKGLKNLNDTAKTLEENAEKSLMNEYINLLESNGVDTSNKTENEIRVLAQIEIEKLEDLMMNGLGK